MALRLWRQMLAVSLLKAWGRLPCRKRCSCFHRTTCFARCVNRASSKLQSRVMQSVSPDPPSATCFLCFCRLHPPALCLPVWAAGGGPLAAVPRRPPRPGSACRRPGHAAVPLSGREAVSDDSFPTEGRGGPDRHGHPWVAGAEGWHGWVGWPGEGMCTLAGRAAGGRPGSAAACGPGTCSQQCKLLSRR